MLYYSDMQPPDHNVAIANIEEKGGDGNASHPLPTASIADRIGRPLLWVPLAIAASCIAISVTVGFVRAILQPQPENPWESGQIVEAWRTVQGLPVYEWPAAGHATECYGPLEPWVLGAAFRLTGLTSWTGRVLQLASAIALLGVLLAICRRSRSYSPLLTFVTATLFLGIDASSGHYFVQNRPDMTALLLGTLSLTILYRSIQDNRRLLFAAGTCLMLIACLFKQTMALVSLIPIAQLLLDRRRGLMERLTLAVTPLAAIAGLFLFFKLRRPVTYHYMVIVLRQYRIVPSVAAHGLAALVSAVPLFPICLTAWISRTNRKREWLLTWVVAALVITIPASLMTYAVQGGGPNALLPALLSMAFFSALYLPELVAPLADASTRGSHRFAFSSVIGTLLIVGAIDGVVNVTHDPGYSDYHAVIKEIAGLAPRRVIAPEDPSIPLRALGTFGRNIYLEYDAIGLPRYIPEYLASEIRSADYVVDVKNWWQNVLTEEMLHDFDFERISQHEHYSIWRHR